MEFMSQLSKILNSGQSRSVILHGNIHDLFCLRSGGKWVPLVELLQSKCAVESTETQKGITLIICRNNAPLEVVGEENLKELEVMWARMSPGPISPKSLKTQLEETRDNPTVAVELLYQLTRLTKLAHNKLKNNLLIIIDSAEMLFPETPIDRMMPADRKRLTIATDWFKDPNFVNGHDTVLLIAEAKSAIHQRISRLPQVLSIDIPLPDLNSRYQFILHHPASEAYKAVDPVETTGSRHTCTLADTIAGATSGLSIHAVNQLLRSGDYSLDNVTRKVGEYMISQLGEGVVEFIRPTHTVDNIIGFSRLKTFIREELLPSIAKNDDGCPSGILVVGPIGGGKTHICGGIAGELDFPIIILKNIRSKWYGSTDEIMERLQRLIGSFNKIGIFVDEADTQFGGVDSEQDTERRLTGKIQAMMSDPTMRGRAVWFLMTARVHKLSPDIRRPGRMDYIIPILDPDGEDYHDFLKWTFGEDLLDQDTENKIRKYTNGMSSASFAMIRSMIRRKGINTIDGVVRLIEDLVEPDIKEVRRFQTLQGMLNCTRKSLLLDGKIRIDNFEVHRGEWREEIAKLEAKGFG